MADTLEALQARLQQAQADYMRTLQETWEAWLKQYEELNQQQLRAYQDLMTQMQSASGGCATPAGKK